MKNKIEELKKEIEYWDDIEKKIDNCPRENYEEYTKLEKLWMNCPIDTLKAKLQAFQEAQKIQNEKVEKLKEEIIKEKELDVKYIKTSQKTGLFDIIDKIFGGET